MTERTIKDKRITIRLPDDLHAWVEAQAAELALDAAAFVRMSLQQRRNGHVSAPGLISSETAEAELRRIRARDEQINDERHEPSDAVPSPDDLVRQALATAEAAGLAKPQTTEDDYPEFGGSVRPVGPRKTWDPYHAKERARA